MELFDDAMLQAFDAATAPVNHARILPPLLYTSPEFYAFEKRTIFEQEWVCVGRADQIPQAGDWFQITLIDEPLLVVRDTDETIRVLSGVCQHRGMLIAEGTGNTNRFMCPYHHWCYRLDGGLLTTPEMDQAVGFERSDFSLPSLPVEMWNGFIFTTFNPDPPPLLPGFDKLTALLEHFALSYCHTVIGETYEDLPWNWKVMHENFNDGYHANRLHLGIGDHLPSKNAKFLDLDENDTHITRLNYCTHIDGSFSPTGKCVLPVFSGLTEDERHRAIFALLPPTLGLAIAPDNVTYFIVNPKAAERIDIHIGYCIDPRAPKSPVFEYLFEEFKAGVNNFNVQDIHADTMVQRGLRSRFGPHGRYSWQEETLRQLNVWLVKRYRAAWPHQA